MFVDGIHDRVQTVLGQVALIVGCHQRADRSFVVRGRQVPLCARCIGILLGLVSATFLPVSRLGFCCFLLVPLLLDGVTQYLGLRESNNSLRMITGLLFGCGFANYLILFLRSLYKYGKSNSIL